jgi:drug/metabolite transporter (DMT)-like permease
VSGATFTFLAVTASALGSLVAHRNREARLPLWQLPLWQMMGWGMLYGGALSFPVMPALGKPLGFEATPGYVLPLLYLAVFGSIIAFAGFLTLIQRVGAARAGYVGVMVPIVALVVSAAFEAFHWQALAWGGIAVSVAGNVVILRVRRAAVPAR